MPDELIIARGRVIPPFALAVKTARASGPGGQHVNRTESKVQLTFDPAAVAWLDESAKKRLYQLAGRSVDAAGQILVASQQYRDQARNLERAREKLASWVAQALVRPKRRTSTKPTRASKERRLENKKRRANIKSTRGRVKED